MPPEISDWIAQFGLPTSLLLVVGGAFYKEMRERIKRSEDLTDRAVSGVDKLADAVEAQNATTKALLDRLDRKGS